MRAHRQARISTMTAAVLTAATIVLGASPALAAPDWLTMPDLGWEGSRAQDVTARTVDVLLVRPLATVRVVVGSLLFVPAFVVSSPMGEEGLDGAYEVMIGEPYEYAFRRPIGEL